jgi:hypothetical protein
MKFLMPFVVAFLNLDLIYAQSCLKKNSTAVGNELVGTSSSDFEYLSTSEKDSFYFRLETL